MPLDRRKTEQALTGKLDMVLRDRRRDDHRYYQFVQNGKVIVQTKISTGSGHRDISDPIVGAIARQLQIPTPFLVEIVGCTKSLPEFLDYLSSRDLIE